MFELNTPHKPEKALFRISEGAVLTGELIERWISYKRENEITPLRLRPHPLEFSMYYDI